MTRILRGAVAAAVLVMLVALPGYGHADLVESDPADGATIATPYELSATFSEEFDPDRSFIRVRAPSGEIVAEGGQSADDPLTMNVDLPELPPGDYIAGWQTVTPDDNGRENGTFTFSVAQTGPGATFTAAPTASANATSRPSVAVATATPVAPSPAPTPTAEGPGTASGTDILLALALAALALLGLGAYLFTRRR